MPQTRLDDMRTEKQNSWHHSDNASFFHHAVGNNRSGCLAGMAFQLTLSQPHFPDRELEESRKSELVQMLDTLMNAQRSTPKELERLHGRLIWFSAFVFGRMMNQLVKAVSQECLKRTSSEFLHTLNDLKAANHVVKACGDFQILVHHLVCLYRRGVRT